MRPSDKFYPVILALLAGGLTLALSCASGPSTPEDENNAPVFDSLTVSGNKPVIAEGAIGLLLKAYVHDIDGDEVTLEWTGPGLFYGENQTQKTVFWNVPADTFGTLTIACTADDGAATGSTTRSFQVGRALTGNDFGDVVGDQVRWTRADAPFYIMDADLEIPSDYQLYIGEGCQIYVGEDRSLKVQGGLYIDGGNGYDQVIFKPYGAPTENREWWDGIVFESSEDSLWVQWAIFRNASRGLEMQLGVPQGATVRNALFDHCRKGILARSTPLTLSGVYVQGAEVGLDLGACELFVEGCNFGDTSAQNMIVFNTSSGLVTGCFFDGQSEQSVSISGQSLVQFHDNRFFGENIVFLVDGYDAGSSLDITCNYWGENANLATIETRIQRGSQAPLVLFDPFQAFPGAECP